MKNKKTIIIIVTIAVLLLIGIAAICFLKNNKKENNSGTSKAFSMIYKGVEVLPGTKFDENQIEEKANFSEIPSCAFSETDKVYTYEGIEIIVAQIDNIDKVYSVYFINDLAQTGEGLKISDNKQKMIETYGEDYNLSMDNKYTYTRENVELSFVVGNDTITSIEYTLKTDK